MGAEIAALSHDEELHEAGFLSSFQLLCCLEILSQCGRFIDKGWLHPACSL